MYINLSELFRSNASSLFCLFVCFQLVGPFDSKEIFQEADFTVLYSFETDSHATAVLEQVQDLVLPNLDPDSDTAEFRSELVMQLSSLRRSEQKEKRIKLPILSKQSRLDHNKAHVSVSIEYKMYTCTCTCVNICMFQCNL